MRRAEAGVTGTISKPSPPIRLATSARTLRRPATMSASAHGAGRDQNPVLGVERGDAGAGFRLVEDDRHERRRVGAALRQASPVRKSKSQPRSAAST
jgi:hypothetical protein